MIALDPGIENRTSEVDAPESIVIADVVQNYAVTAGCNSILAVVVGSVVFVTRRLQSKDAVGVADGDARGDDGIRTGIDPIASVIEGNAPGQNAVVADRKAGGALLFDAVGKGASLCTAKSVAATRRPRYLTVFDVRIVSHDDAAPAISHLDIFDVRVLDRDHG